jgi:hypothetical protein
MLPVVLLAVGALGAVLAPFVLARANPGQIIPRRENRWIVPFYVTYAVGVAAFIVGALFSSIAPLWGALLVLPMMLVVQRHNAKTV